MKNQVSEVEKKFLERKLNIKSPKAKKKKVVDHGNEWKLLFYHFYPLHSLSVCLHSRMFSVDIPLSLLFAMKKPQFISATHISYHLVVVCRRSFNDSRVSLRRWYLACLEYTCYMKWTYDFWLLNVSSNAAFLGSCTMPDSLESRFFIIMQVSSHENWTLFVNHLQCCVRREQQKCNK